MSSTWLRLIGTVSVLMLVLALPGTSATAQDDVSIAQACPPDRVPDSTFADTAGNTHEAGINCTVWYEVTRGVDGRRYAPDRTVGRDQMAAFVARALGQAIDLPSPAVQGFRDVAGNPHEARILQLAELGLVRGTTVDTYSPGVPVSRAQMATFLVRAVEYVSGQALPAGSDRFADDGANPHEGNINKAAAAGITTGTSALVFSPSAVVPRDQLASFVARMLNKLVADGHMTADPTPQPDPPPPPRGEQGVANTGTGDDLQFEHEETTVQLSVSRLQPGATYNVRYIRTDGLSYPVLEGVTTDGEGAFERQVVIPNTGPAALDLAQPSSSRLAAAASPTASAYLHVFNTAGECVALTELFVAATESGGPDWTVEETLPAPNVPGGEAVVRTGDQKGPKGSHRGWGRVHVETERGEWGPGTDVYDKTRKTLLNPDEVETYGTSKRHKKGSWIVIIETGRARESPDGEMMGLITSRPDSAQTSP